MTWEHITPIHGTAIGADIDCSGTQYPAKFALAADFDGDGRAEVLVAPDVGGSRGNDLWVMKFDEDSGGWQHMAPIPGYESEADIDCSGTQYPAKFALATDFDEDGRAEVLVAPDVGGSRGNDLWVMKFDEDSGGWQHMAPIPGYESEADIDCSGTQYPAKFALAADFDEDGRAEVLVAPDVGGSRGNDLWVMKFDEDSGGWQHMAPIPGCESEADIDCSGTQYPAKFALAADFDEDGRAEVLVAPDVGGSRGNDLWVLGFKTEDVRVVNMIPNILSGEVNQDSEPSIAVNPANPAQMAASAFTPNPATGPPPPTSAPIYVSHDGGATWCLNPILPNVPSPNATADITLRFASTTNNLYAAILDPHSTSLNLLRTANYLSATDMTVLVPAPPGDPSRKSIRSGPTSHIWKRSA